MMTRSKSCAPSSATDPDRHARHGDRSPRCGCRCLLLLTGRPLLRALAVPPAAAGVVAAAAGFVCAPVVLSCGSWQARRPSLALKAWLAALIGGLLLSAAAGSALSAGALDAESTGAGSQALVPWIAGWVALSAAG